MEETKKEGKVSEEELENVAGGYSEDEQIEALRRDAEADGHTVLVELNRGCPEKDCKYCHAPKSIYAREKTNIKHGLDVYRDCICYSCHVHFGDLDTMGNRVD